MRFRLIFLRIALCWRRARTCYTFRPFSTKCVVFASLGLSHPVYSFLLQRVFRLRPALQNAGER